MTDGCMTRFRELTDMTVPGGAAAAPFHAQLAAALSQLLGRAVQVDPIKPLLKPPGTKQLKVKYYKFLSSFAFKFNLRRFSWGRRSPTAASRITRRRRQGLTLVHFLAQLEHFLWDKGCA
jgi:hypothetical protein